MAKCGCYTATSFPLRLRPSGRPNQTFFLCEKHRTEAEGNKATLALSYDPSVAEEIDNLKSKLRELEEGYAVAMDAILSILPTSSLEKLTTNQQSILERLVMKISNSKPE